MPKQPAYIINLKAASRAEPDQSHLKQLMKELYGSDSDRATVVLFGSFVQAHLERLLATIFRDDMNSEDRQKLLDYEGPIGTFSSQIITAYALKMIGPMVQFDLDLVRLLRNEFAHSRVPLSFNTPEVIEVIKKFKIVDLPHSIPYGYLAGTEPLNSPESIDLKNTKTRFISTCHNISYRIKVKQNGPRAGDFAFPDNDPVP